MQYSKAFMRGFSQIMLQNNSLTGSLILIGIFLNSWIMGLGAVIGIASGTLFAILLSYNKKDIFNGLYGFNAALIGIALSFLFKMNFLLIITIILGSIFSSIVMNLIMRKKLPAYTFPFVITTWLIIFFSSFFLEKNINQAVESSGLNIVSAVAMGFGQVMFQASIIAGIIFFIAILVSSVRTAIFGLFGSIIGIILALLVSAPLSLVNIGIFGFNGVLCGIAFSNEKRSIYALIAIILSATILFAFLKLNLPALTAPFVFASWTTLFLININIKLDFHKP